VVEEAAAAGAATVAIVVQPGVEAAYRAADGCAASTLTLIPQTEPRGYGDAIKLARAFAADEPFIHFAGDHLFVSDTAGRCVEHLVAAAQAEACSVSAVQPTREHMLPYFGAVGGRRPDARPVGDPTSSTTSPRLHGGFGGIVTVIRGHFGAGPVEGERLELAPKFRGGSRIDSTGLKIDRRRIHGCDAPRNFRPLGWCQVGEFIEDFGDAHHSPLVGTKTARKYAFSCSVGKATFLLSRGRRGPEACG